MESVPFDRRNEDTNKFAEKLGRLKDLRSANQDLLDNINSINEQIVEAKIRLVPLKNDNILYASIINALESAPPLLEEAADDDYQDLLKEHNVAINGRLNKVTRMQAKIDEEEGKINELEETYEKLLCEELAIKQKINNLNHQNREYNLIEKCATEEKTFLDTQQKELKREISQMDSIYKEACIAYNKLVDRSTMIHNDDTHDIAHEIRDKQNEIVRLEEKIAGIRKSLYNLSVYSERKDAEAKFTSEEVTKAANWQAERKFLQESLANVKREIAEANVDAKSTMSKSARSISAMAPFMRLSYEEEQKYGWLCRGWGQRAAENDPVRGDLEGLWASVIGPRQQLACLLEENAKKEAELKKKQRALSRHVQKFRDAEARENAGAEQRQVEFAEAEARLLAKIKQTKLALAQQRINKMRRK